LSKHKRVANEVILAQFEADLSKVKRDFEAYIKLLKDAEKAEDKLGDEAEQSAKQQQTAAQKRKELLKQEEAELKRLIIAKRQAFSVADISAFNTKINESRSRISILKDETSGFGSSIKASLAGIGAGIAAAFSIQAITAFAGQSIDAFLEAEENANKLAFAIKSIGKESDVAFQGLIKQSEELQKVTIFSDDDIQKAQTALAVFGLTSKQIEDLLPGLTDFATVTGQSIESAAQAVGGGLQGMGKEFKRLGVDIDATKTPLENLTEITRYFTTIEGAAAKETETLNGQLKQQANEVDNLQEQIGEKLAPAWVSLKKAVFEGALLLIDDIKRLASGDFSQLFIRDAKAGATAIESVTDAVKKRTAELVADGATQAEASKQSIKLVREELIATQKLNIEQAKANQGKLNPEQQRITTQRLSRIKEELTIIQQFALKTDEIVTDSTLKASDLQGKSIEELNKLLKENELSNTIDAQSNVKIIERVIEQRKKELEALKKVNEELAKKRQLEKEGQRRIDNTDREEANAKRQDEAIKTASDDIAQASADSRLGIETEFVNDLNKLNEKSVEDREKANDQITKDLEKAAKERTNIATIELLEQAQKVGEFVSTVTQLFGQISESRIQNINEDTEATLASIQLQEEAIDRSLEKNRISEEEAAALKAKLEKKKVEEQKKADAEIRRLRRNQAILDKSAAIFEIILATATNVAKASTPFEKILAAASGAAQIAVVAATPIPSYAKGTKDSGKEGLAQVHKDEVMFLPAKSKVLPARRAKQYSEALDSMFDGTFEQHIYNNYVSKEVNKIAKEKETIKSREFADNLVASTTYQKEYLPSLHDRKNKPTKIENVNELAEAIADKLRGSYYR
jgi:hypothetical protein